MCPDTRCLPMKMRVLDAGTLGQPHVPPAPPSHPLAVLKGFGWLLVGTGLVGNEWVLTTLLSDDGIVEIQNRVAVWLFDILCMALGLFCVQMAKRLTARDVLQRLSQAYPGTVACCIGLLLTVFLVVCTEGVFYGLNHYRQEQTVAEVSWIRIPPPDEKLPVTHNFYFRGSWGMLEPS